MIILICEAESKISDAFFFSSRRRHTRWPRDWSSDVCSSDLGDWLGRSLRPRGGARVARWDGPSGQGCRPALALDRRGHLHLHEHSHHGVRVVTMTEPKRTPPPPPAETPAVTTPADALPWLEELPPRKIVAELDRYIVG